MTTPAESARGGGAPRVLGCVLAGGASRRMGRDKALAFLLGRPLVEHVIERMRPQVERVCLSTHDDGEPSLAWPDRVVDAGGERLGPLGGIAAGLRFAQAAGFDALAVAPCDAPFLPLDLVGRLLAAFAPNHIVAARSARGPEPLLSLWPLAASDWIAQAFAQGLRSPARLIESRPHAYADFAASDQGAFLNINDAPALAAAESALAGAFRADRIGAAL